MNEIKKLARYLKEYEAAFELYKKDKIETVTMQQVADQAGIGVATVYRHYKTKLELAARVCAYKLGSYFFEATKERTPEFLKDVDAIDRLGFTFDLYIDLYKNHKDILRVNDDFNHFYQENKNSTLPPEYEQAMGAFTARFHTMYERAKSDGTMRTDIPEEELQRLLLHTMMGAVNHYVGGFNFCRQEDEDYTKELIRLKGILMDFARGKINVDI